MDTADIDAFIAERKEKAAHLRRDLEIFEAETRGMERLRDLLLRAQAPAPSSSSPATTPSQSPSDLVGMPEEHGAQTDGVVGAPQVPNEGGASPLQALSQELSKDAEETGGGSDLHRSGGGLTSWLKGSG